MKALSARNAIDELDATDLDQAVTLVWIEAGGLGIEDDFAHRALVPTEVRASGRYPCELRNRDTFRRRIDSSFRHCSDRGEDGTYLRARRLETMRSIHDKIGAAAFLGIRHLSGEHRFELIHGHAGTLEHPRALHLGRRRYHHDGVHTLVGTGLEQQRNIEHGGFSPRARACARRSRSACCTSG